MTAETDNASAVLLEFMSEMKGWENKFATLYKRENGGPEAHASQAKIELEQIYDKYLTKRDRKHGRMASASTGWPPEFDPDAEELVGTELINGRRLFSKRCGRIQRRCHAIRKDIVSQCSTRTASGD